MKKSLALMLFLGTTGAAAISLPVSADSMGVPVGQQGEQSIQTPERGLTKAQVLARFGEPKSRMSAVGEPPITRWVYNGYTVYFDNDYVVHSVRHPNP